MAQCVRVRGPINRIHSSTREERRKAEGKGKGEKPQKRKVTRKLVARSLSYSFSLVLSRSVRVNHPQKEFFTLENIIK